MAKYARCKDKGWPVGTSGAPCLSPFKATSKRSAGDFCPIWDQSHRSPSYAPKHKTRLGGAMLRLWVETKHYQSRSSLSPGTLITHLLGEQSRYKHGDRPNLAVQLLWVGPLWGPRHTPPTTRKLPKALNRPPYFHQAATGGLVEGPLTQALYVHMSQWRWRPALAPTTQRGAALRQAPLELCYPLTYDTYYTRYIWPLKHGLITLRRHS